MFFFTGSIQYLYFMFFKKTFPYKAPALLCGIVTLHNETAPHSYQTSKFQTVPMLNFKALKRILIITCNFMI